jgi:uncharacterized protein
MNETVIEGPGKTNIRRGIVAVLVLLSLFLLAKTVSELMGMRFIGSGLQATNVITVEGEGEAFAVPDVGEFTFSIVEKASTVAAAQESAAKKMNATLDYLKSQAIDEKDIKTVGYNVNPAYEWQETRCAIGVPCPGGKQVLTGYEVRQTISVKVRDTKKAGDLLSGVGSKGATELSGLSFTVEDEDKLKADARDQAIGKAKAHADALASQLGVRLVRIVNFNESGMPSPMPYYARESLGMGAADAKVANQASVPTGENKIVSHVVITYEIR